MCAYRPPAPFAGRRWRSRRPPCTCRRETRSIRDLLANQVCGGHDLPQAISPINVPANQVCGGHDDAEYGSGLPVDLVLTHEGAYTHNTLSENQKYARCAVNLLPQKSTMFFLKK